MKGQYVERMARLLPIPVSQRLLVLAAAALMVFLALPQTTHADSTIPVTPGHTIDEMTNNGLCSLREAIQSANLNTNFDGDCAPGGSGTDTVTVPAGNYILTRTGPGEDVNAIGDLDITENVTINGADAATTTIDGFNSDRVFDIQTGAKATISNVTIRQGNSAGGQGGGIRNKGTLILNGSTVKNNSGSIGAGIFNAVMATLNNSTVSGNSASSEGGGIYNAPSTLIASSTLIVTNSTVSGNTAFSAGGGIFSGPAEGCALGIVTAVTLTGSTVSGNSAYMGGGIRNQAFCQSALSQLTVLNSTISKNLGDLGAGIYNNGATTLNFTTLADNLVLTNGTGGGVVNEDSAADLSVENTIIANNSTYDCSGSLTSAGHNLIKNTSACAIGGDTTGNITGFDPVLGLLQNNGGPTETRALGTGSQAIDAGSGDCPPPATDQHGVTRPYPAGGRCDIGAYEVAPTCSITVTKLIDPSSIFVTLFNFTVDGTSFNMFSGSSQTIIVPCLSSTPPQAASHTVTETPAANWATTSIDCQLVSGSMSHPVVYTSNSAQFQLGTEGSNAHCTFTNTQTCTVTIKKQTNPAGGTGFNFSSAWNGLQGITLDDDGSATREVDCGPIYDVYETPQPGWVLTNIACVFNPITIGSGGNFRIRGGADPTLGFDVGDNQVVFDSLTPGTNLECTFTNTSPCATGISMNTGTGSTDPNDHATDPIWSVGLGTAGVSGPAFGTPPAGPWVLPATVPGGAGTWVEPDANGIYSDPVGTYDYNTSFFIPAGAPILLNIYYAADESVVFTLTGPSPLTPPFIVTSPPSASGLPAPYRVTYTSDPVGGGTYTLHATVTNGPGGSPTDTINPSGLLVKGTVKCVTPVGGATTLTVSTSGSSVPWTPLAAVAAGVMAVLAVGGWYGRRRWLR